MAFDSNVRRTPQGGFEWLSYRAAGDSITLCADGEQVTLNQWNPATGVVQQQDLDIKGFIALQMPLSSGTMFVWKITDCDAKGRQTGTRWRAAWRTPHGVINTPMPAPPDERMLQAVEMSDDAVVVLEYAPDAHHLGAYLVHRDGQQLSGETFPDLEESFSERLTAVALDDHRLMILGGSNGEYRACAIPKTCRASTHVLDLQRRQWSNGPNMREARSEAAAFRLPDGSVIVAGGWTPKDNWGPGPSHSAERWDPERNVFEPMPPMPEATALANGHWFPGQEGRIVVFAEGVSAGLPAFDLATQSWFNAGSWQQGGAGGACTFFPFVFEGRLYAWQQFTGTSFYNDKSCFGNHTLAQLHLPGDLAASFDERPLNSGDVIARSVGGEAAFLALQDNRAAINVGGQMHAGSNNYTCTGIVEAISASGDLAPLPSLRHPRCNAAVYRLGDGVLVVGGNDANVYRRENPVLPAEWLPTAQRGLQVRWQDVKVPFEPTDVVGQSGDRLFVLGDEGTIDQVGLREQDGVPVFERGAWLHLDHARRATHDSAVRVRELADGRVLIAGGEVQTERVAVLSDANCCSDGPDEYVSVGPFSSSASVETYSPDSRQWTSSVPSKLPLATISILEDGRIVSAHPPAAQDGTVRVEMLDPAADAWTDAQAPLPGFASAPRWIELQGELLLAGEIEAPDDQSRPRGVQRLDPHTGTWSWLWKDPQRRDESQYGHIVVMARLPNGKTLLVPAEDL